MSRPSNAIASIFISRLSPALSFNASPRSTARARIGKLAQADEKGAQWDLIVSQGEKSKITEDQVEEALNSLMDKGVVYEPILGRLKMA